VATVPARMRAAVDDLSETQLDTPYRPGGWTVRQLVHHVSDSHINAYVRMKWGLTEDAPAIKTYDEKVWAELLDACTASVEISLQLLTGLCEMGRPAKRDDDRGFRPHDPSSRDGRDDASGTAGITWRTLNDCASGRAGEDERVHPSNKKMGAGTMPTPRPGVR